MRLSTINRSVCTSSSYYCLTTCKELAKNIYQLFINYLVILHNFCIFACYAVGVRKNLLFHIERKGIMVSSIQGLGQIMGSMMSQKTEGLTDDQKSTIASILSNYDSSNVTKEDAVSIFQEFKDAGITPTRGMKEAIEAAGFDAEDLRSKGLSDQGTPPPPPQQSSSSQSVNLSALQSLQEILSQYDLTNLSDTDQTSLVNKLESSGFLYPGSVLDVKS
jgi:hypothetical protein